MVIFGVGTSVECPEENYSSNFIPLYERVFSFGGIPQTPRDRFARTYVTVVMKRSNKCVYK
jgi:hypothetical protein